LRALTLQQARLVGPAAELLLWRTEGGWQARLVTDDVGDEVECFDEWQILWGTRCEGSRDGFTLVADGAQGLRHAPPVRVDVRLFDPGENRRPLRLQVRHYLETDTESGLLRVTLSRLVQVTDETQVRKEQER
jgi:CRISPR-associated protein (TIGR03984 family)